MDRPQNQAQSAGSTPPNIPNGVQISNGSFNDESLGWINTIKGKPLQLIMVQDNKMESFLYPNKP